MQVETLVLEGLLLITPDVFSDERGHFLESYSEQRYLELGIPHFVQDNESRSSQWVLRGLHYQLPPYEQGKLVHVVRGEVLDVVVDLRLGSPTQGHYEAITLSDRNKKQLWIPPGFAHGFLALSEEVCFSYKCTHYYRKEAERGILWNDPTLGIAWGIEHPIVSAKDLHNDSLSVALMHRSRV